MKGDFQDIKVNRFSPFIIIITICWALHMKCADWELKTKKLLQILGLRYSSSKLTWWKRKKNLCFHLFICNKYFYFFFYILHTCKCVSFKTCIVSWLLQVCSDRYYRFMSIWVWNYKGKVQKAFSLNIIWSGFGKW